MLLTHQPEDITAQALIDGEVATNPELGEEWPVFSSGEPNEPDSVLTVTGTTPQMDGNSMVDGEEDRHWGVQVRVRGTTGPAAWRKAISLVNFLTRNVNGMLVVVDGTEYVIDCFSNVNGPLFVGKNVPPNKLTVYTINALLSVVEV